MKKLKIILSTILVLMFCVFVGQVYAEENIDVIEAQNTPIAEVEVKYEYKEETNTVIVTMISDIELQDTKILWKLSEDKKQYTFEFSDNTTYTTNVVDIYGNIIPVHINVTDVVNKIANVEVKYKYQKDTNTVIVTMISDIELQDTKISWKLSEDKKQYTFEFSDNTTYTTNVVDIYGNIIPVHINVTDVVNKIANVEVKYKYQKDTNTVIATIISNMELQNTKVSWKLSENKKQYTFEFSNNTKYTTNVVDRFGNVIPVLIDINKIDESPAKVKVEYEYKEDTNTVIATMVSNRELQNTKVSWKLSDDKKQYTFEFTNNTKYTTNVVDRFGNIIPVEINVVKVDDQGPEISIKYEYSEDKTQCTVRVISNEELKPKISPEWVLSEDKKELTIIFKNNQNYDTVFYDKYGNGTRAHMDVFFNITGIDVSKHNGKIDWQKVKNAGIEFAIIRVGYGQDISSQDDAMFEYNISECERLGIPYGVYLYSYALNTENASSEADHMLRLIKGHNPKYGIWIDLEDDSYKVNNGMPSNETFVEIAVTFCEKMIQNGYKDVGIYANLEWWNNRINSPKLDKYDKWVAQWNDKCTYQKEYVMWQYTSKGQVDGISGNVDMNKYYRNK